MTQGTDRPDDALPQKIILSTVANPRRTRVDADGRPETTPAATQRTQGD